MLKLPLCILICWWCLFPLEIAAQIEEPNQSAKIEQLIFSGHLADAEAQLHKLLADTSLSKNHQAELYTLAGNIEKIRGDMEQTLHFWEKSIDLRKQMYLPGDYRLAWNYALLSNYHYEKINHLQAKAYADSCWVLIDNLNTTQQLEIRIHLIWNILAQSDKLHPSYFSLDFDDLHPVYLQVWEVYERSIAFQLAHSTPKYHLAKTYHLLGNAYHDLIPRTHEKPRKDKYGDQVFTNTQHYYNKALHVWTTLYGERHYQAALTHFVQAMSCWKMPLEKHPNKFTVSNAHFEKALSAWGVSDVANENELEPIPNKLDLLMCLKIYSESLFGTFNQTENRDYFERTIELNNWSIVIWESIYNTFTSANTNQFLASYHVIPYNITYHIELEKQRIGMDYSHEKMFTANQRLKYFDLIKHTLADTVVQPRISIEQIQQQLKPDECFLDFFLYHKGRNNTMAIYPDSVVIRQTTRDFRKDVDHLNASIVASHFNEYTEGARHLYNNFFGDLDFTGINKLYICPFGELNNLPFDALLCSDTGIDSRDYRKLDYLLNKFEVEYVLSTATFETKPDTLPYNLAMYAPAAPTQSAFSELPFSRQLAEEVEKSGFGTSYTDSVIDLAQLFHSPSSILHLSTHGLIEPNHSEYSELILGKSKLQLNDVYQREINAQLVVLNACNSSRGMVFTDDGVHGFSRAFFSAGATAVMSNLWEVDDKASNQIMRDFYHNLKGGHSTFNALRQAKQRQVSEAENSNLAAPYYWAGHALVGQKMVFVHRDIEADHFGWKGAAVAILLLVVGGGLWVWRRK